MDETIINNFADKINEKEKSSNKTSSWSGTTNNIRYPTEKLVKDSLDAKSDSTHTHNSQISYGQVNSTSTSTVFTATVSGVTALTDGTTVMLRNGIVTSASGFTLNVNNLGAKPVYNSMADASADTTIFNINYTMLFVYDSTRISGGCWICYRGYNSDNNTIGYQIRTNSTSFTPLDKTYRYRIMLEVENNKLMPVNTSTSTSATASKTSTMNTREFKLGGNIYYYSYSSTINANAYFGTGYIWRQYNFALGYSFNNTNAALVMTAKEPVYMIAEQTSNGMAKLKTPFFTQTLPNTADGLLYILLGYATSEVNLELTLDHPIYEYRDGGIKLYRDTYTKNETDTLLNGKASSSHTHTTSQITDFPSTMTPSSHTHGNLQNDGSVGTSNNASKNVVTDSSGKITTEAKPTIPTKTSELTNDSGFLTSHQDISSKLDKVQTSYKGKNVVVDSNNGNITFEDKNNHTHSNYLTSHQDISGKENKSNKSSSISTDTGSTSKYPSVKAVEDYTHIDVIDTRLQKEEIVYGTIYKTDSSKTYISGTYYKVSSSIPSELILFKLPDDINTSSTKSLCIKISYYYNSYTNSSSSLELDVKYNNNIVKENTFLPNTIILLQDATSYFDIVGVLSPNSTGSYNDLTNKPSIPSKTSDLTNDSGFLTSHQDISGKLDKAQTSHKGKNVVVDSSTGNITFEDKNNHTHSQYLTEHQSLSNYVTNSDSRLSDARTPLSHTHGNLQNNGQVGSTAQANKNVVTNSNGLITTEDKPTIPSASSITPSADTENGSYGSGTNYARANHTHPKSSLYAEATHTHSQYLTEHQDLSNYVTTDDSRLSDARTPTSHTHTKSQITDFPTLPTASSTVPSADTTNGSYGSGTSYARSNHTHPKSSLYAESSHTHSQYLTEHQSLSNYVTNSDSRLSDARTPLSHSHGNLQDDGKIGTTNNASKNVVTDSNGKITTEDKLSFYIYELTSSTYNAAIDTAFTITVKVTDAFGNNVNNKSVTLYHDGTSVSSQNTNSSGVATWTITPSTWGIHDFNVSNTHCQVQVDGWRWTQNETTWRIGRNADHGILILKGWSSNAPTSWKQFGGQAYAYGFRPIVNTYQQNDRVIWIVNAENGTISFKSTTGSAINTTAWYGQIEWAINQ